MGRSSGEEQPQRAPARVLAVDDSPVFLSTLEAIFGPERIETTTSVRDALRRLEEAPSLRVVLADLMLPGGGVAFLRSLRERFPERAVIAVSGDPAALPAETAAELGVLRTLIKGRATVEDFEEAVQQALEGFDAGP